MRKNLPLEGIIKDGMTVAISGVDSSYYPRKLIHALMDSGAKGLTLIFNELNAESEGFGEVAADPVELIRAGRVKHLITSHLGELAKTWDRYLECVTILPMDVLNFKLQAGANGLAGIALPRDYVELYRGDEWIECYATPGGLVVEPALRASISLTMADVVDPETFHLAWNGTAFNCMEVAKCGDVCFAEALTEGHLWYQQVDVPGQYVSGYVLAGAGKFEKLNWEV